MRLDAYDTAPQIAGLVQPPPTILRLPDLTMQAAQDVAGGLGVIVLHKIDIEPGRFMEGAPVETLEEEAPVVAEHFRFDEQHIGNPGRRSLHQNTFSLSTLIKYWP